MEIYKKQKICNQYACFFLKYYSFDKLEIFTQDDFCEKSIKSASNPIRLLLKNKQNKTN